MKRMSFVFGPLLVTVSAASDALAKQRSLQKTAEECLLLDDQHVAGIEDLASYEGGSWVDDGDILKTEWEPGMGVFAINYCISLEDTFRSMEVIVGDSENQVKLYKHGGEGGICRKWTIRDDDYIREIQFTWNDFTGNLVQVQFTTHLGQERVFGRGEGRKVNLEYTTFQPFVGLYSYMSTYDTAVAFGAYEDDCHNAPKKLPFSLENVIPSFAELEGTSAVSSLTWVNQQHGTSSKEVKLLDQIVEEEIKEDSRIDDNPQSESETNDDSVEENGNEDDITPSEPNPEPTDQPDSPASRPEQPSQAQISNKQLQEELERVKNELVTKENQLRQQNSDVEKAWLLFALLVFLVVIMLFIVAFLCCHLKTVKKQRRNALDIEQRSSMRESEVEAGDQKKKLTASPSIKSPAESPTQFVMQKRVSRASTGIGLLRQSDAAGDTTVTPIANNKAPVGFGSYMNDQTDQLKGADKVDALDSIGKDGSPNEASFEFFESEPEVSDFTQIGDRSPNPFASELSVDADMSLSEESQGVPTPRGPQEVVAVQANPNTRV